MTINQCRLLRHSLLLLLLLLYCDLMRRDNIDIEFLRSVCCCDSADDVDDVAVVRVVLK